MSSTTQPRRTGPDFYQTPDSAILPLLPYLPLGTKGNVGVCAVLEPCAGNGAILRHLVRHYPDAMIGAYELREEEAGALNEVLMPAQFKTLGCPTDFLSLPARPVADLIVTNPPFSLAQEFVERSLDWLAPGGRAFFLLRLAFWESAKRATLLGRHAPDTYVLPRRPSFTGGATDSCAYAWFGWHQAPRESGQIRVLEVA